MATPVFEEFRTKWVDAIHSAAGASPGPTPVWHGPDEIVAALTPFLGTVNHLHFPDGGGHDLKDVALGSEPGTLEFIITDRSAYLGKPSTMTLEYIAAVPAESFLIIEFESLDPSGVYEASQDEQRPRRGEELVELSLGDYVGRGVWDAGHLGYDDDGREVPLPEGARLLHRMFGGRLMLVTKGSLWNGAPQTYDGRHDRMSNQEIRQLIERSIAAQQEQGA